MTESRAESSSGSHQRGDQEQQEEENDLFSNSSLFLLGNIPGQFRSHHLRNYFSHLIENQAFKCFHFKHRPEYHRQQKDQTTTESSTSTSSLSASSLSRGDTAAGTTCCILLVKNGHSRDELVKYHGRHWTDVNEEIMRRKVKLQQLTIREGGEQVSSNDSSTSGSDLSFDKSLILSLPELRPPSCMPQGNVGTSLKVFRELIRSCRLPPRVIRKLKLVFPSSIKRYGAVPLYYGPDREGTSMSDMERKLARKRKSESSKGKDKIVLDSKKRKMAVKNEDVIEEENDEIDENDDYDAEDWERYEALHNDVDKQERTGERLFEEELEVVWDKGSSGLVFYTDASYWDQMDGDFDEKCSQEDDWDVDMSLYYGYESADKAAMDMRDMEIEKRLRAGEDLQDITQYSKLENYGRKLMKEKGWKEGTGLGRTLSGISSPIEAEGQSSHCKTGLGYRGEKLVRRPIQKKTREVLIPTIYDKPDEEKDTVVQTVPSTTLKYRDKIFSAKK